MGDRLGGAFGPAPLTGPTWLTQHPRVQRFCTMLIRKSHYSQYGPTWLTQHPRVQRFCTMLIRKSHYSQYGLPSQPPLQSPSTTRLSSSPAERNAALQPSARAAASIQFCGPAIWPARWCPTPSDARRQAPRPASGSPWRRSPSHCPAIPRPPRRHRVSTLRGPRGSRICGTITYNAVHGLIEEMPDGIENRLRRAAMLTN